VSTVQILWILALAAPALAFVLWPLLRRGATLAGVLPVAPADARRLELQEEKGALYRALKELTFDYEAGHLSEDDYRGLRDRYEARAAEVLGALDHLPPAAPRRRPEPRPVTAAARPGWTRSPVALAGSAVLLLAFGLTLGLSVGRYTQPDETFTPPGGGLPGPQGGNAGRAPGEGAPLAPGMVAGMLQAARQSLEAGQYPQAIAAYQAILKRDPTNVDALTHLAVIVATGGHADAALETLDRALALAPGYAPAHLHRGRVLLEAKQDYAGAIAAWERYLALTPAGPDRERVAAMIADARTRQGTR
jgi:tetratricopeptide (TPR) repeat protein